MPRRLKLILEYDGTDFFGWQIQTRPHEHTNERTIQGTLQEALAKLPGEHSSLKAAGRTDTGVHALAMCAHFDTSTPVPDSEMLRALNAHLPPDVRVLNVERVRDTFEAQYDCLYRRYEYKMRLYREDLRGSSLDRHRVLPIFRTLNVAAMQEAANIFEGEHDFAALATQETRATLRHVYLCKLEAKERDLSLHIVANGFLRNMVRATVGTLFLVGEGKLEPQAIPEILASKNRNRAGENVAPQGLYFVEAGYKPWK